MLQVQCDNCSEVSQDKLNCYCYVAAVVLKAAFVLIGLNFGATIFVGFFYIGILAAVLTLILNLLFITIAIAAASYRGRKKFRRIMHQGLVQGNQYNQHMEIPLEFVTQGHIPDINIEEIQIPGPDQAIIFA